MRPVAEDRMVLDLAGHIEFVGGAAVQFWTVVGRRIRGEDRIALGDQYILHRIAQRHMRDRRLDPQGFLHQVRPGNAALSQIFPLPRTGRRREGGLIEQVHRDLMAGADNRQQGVDRLLLF